ncbi:hypothetical protein KM914_16035 [Virgibacillus pantothenticus]|uniref:hypothetical protein n=1 Tax=Virgibacillus pantothenticus TaxID=1473 RepID=UPI001C22A3B7|nr:hypothetical protein [Virgibacillus pantothenticus]MBU8567912.1 hypothetical protein [Virgibacillus pantothenticus]MBU8601828.1 hypothetical protein [Virgibacillus pantothenticus]MBU8635982.1 hypothetical protein [Virgibacillus pantothenticus]MBU8643666.1 hypothetical protein [Virgibacillus pantothenticus]MBU8647806.1 hypothetical protein [Virgibacillus pantothenticus]
MKIHKSDVITKLKQIINMTVAAESKVEAYFVESDIKPDIALELLKTLNASDDIINYVENDSKFSMLVSANRGFNFTSWYKEKLDNMKYDSIKNAIKYWKEDPISLELSKVAPFTTEQFIKEGIESGLHIIKLEAEKIYDMFINEKEEFHSINRNIELIIRDDN